MFTAASILSVAHRCSAPPRRRRSPSLSAARRRWFYQLRCISLSAASPLALTQLFRASPSRFYPFWWCCPAEIPARPECCCWCKATFPVDDCVEAHDCIPLCPVKLYHYSSFSQSGQLQNERPAPSVLPYLPKHSFAAYDKCHRPLSLVACQRQNSSRVRGRQQAYFFRASGRVHQ